MIPYNKIKEIIKLINAGLDIDTVGKIFNIGDKKIKYLYDHTKQFSKYGVMDEEDGGGATAVPSQPEHSIWNTGVARGHANPIDQNKKWDSGVTRGKSNPLN